VWKKLHGIETVHIMEAAAGKVISNERCGEAGEIFGIADGPRMTTPPFDGVGCGRGT
jgi:hypothetical protein